MTYATWRGLLEAAFFLALLTSVVLDFTGHHTGELEARRWACSFAAIRLSFFIHSPAERAAARRVSQLHYREPQRRTQT